MPRMTLQTRLVLAEFLKDPENPDTELYGREIRDAVGLGPGTIYPILARLEEAGWLTSRREPRRGEPGYTRRPKGGPGRRYYCLTSEGWGVARREAAAAKAARRTRRSKR